MNKLSRIERLYDLGHYGNIKIIDEINEIPEKVFLDSRIIHLLRKLQVIEIENTFNTYLRFCKLTRSNSIDEILEILREEEKVSEKLEEISEFLKTEKTKTFEQLLEEINKLKEEEIKE